MAISLAAASRAHERVGTVLNDKWRIDTLLGVGGMAAVYGATHRNGKRAALKVLHVQLSADPVIVTRFLREGYLANKIAHPGIVSVLDDARTEDGACFLVMEWLEGYSLERHTQSRESALPLDRVLAVTADVLDVLAAAHAVGIVHRDVKPANVFLTRDGHVKVLDFGIARIAESSDPSLTQTGAAIGTPAYMPPEQARGRWNEVDARTDLWSVGATMLALLLGHRPRKGDTAQEELFLAMTQALPPAATLVPDLPPQLAQVIDTAVSFDREHRYIDARTMQMELRRAADAEAINLGKTQLLHAAVDTAPVMHPGMPLSTSNGGSSNPIVPNAGPPSSPSMPSSVSVPGFARGSTVHMANAGVHRVADMPWPIEPVGTTPTRRGALVGVALIALSIVIVGGATYASKHSTRTTDHDRTAGTSGPRVDAPSFDPGTVGAESVESPRTGPSASTSASPSASSVQVSPTMSAIPKPSPRSSASTRASDAPKPSAPTRNAPASIDTSDFFNRRF